MSPRERRIDTRGQGTIGGHGHSHKDRRRENTETSRKPFTEASDRSRGEQESSGYIPEQDHCTPDQRYNSSSGRRRDGEISPNNPGYGYGYIQGRGSYSDQQTRGGNESSGFIPEQDNPSDQRLSTTSPGQRRDDKIRPDDPGYNYIQGRGSYSNQQRSTASSNRRRDGEIRFDSTSYIKGRDSYSNQQSSMTSSNQRRGRENRADCPANISGRTSHRRGRENRADCPANISGRTSHNSDPRRNNTAQIQGYTVQRPGGVDQQGSWLSKNVVEDLQSREPRHSGNGRGHTGQKLARNILSSPPSSPPLTPLTSSAVSSPSSKGKQKCYPPELSALNYMTITSPLTALESPSSYTDNEVELRLAFFKKTHSRNLTPRSQIFIDLYQKTSFLLLSETDTTKRALHQSSLQFFDKFLEENSTILNESRSNAELRVNLSRLKLFEYYSRYGDYFAYQSSKLKKTAIETQTSGHKVFRDYWDKVSLDIMYQMKLMKDHPETPTSRLQSYLALMNVADAMGVDFNHLLTSISAYATRNRLMHSTVNEFIQNGKFHDLAKIIHEDERDLPLIIPYECSEEKAALLQIIATIKEEFYDVDKDDPDDYQRWNHTRKGLEFMKNKALALKRSDELSAQAASRAAKEQKSADEATAAFEAIKTDLRMKRQASKEIPDSVRGEEEERSKKHAKLLGIQTQVNLQGKVLTRLYDKRFEVWSQYGDFETIF